MPYLKLSCIGPEVSLTITMAQQVTRENDAQERLHVVLSCQPEDVLQLLGALTAQLQSAQGLPSLFQAAGLGKGHLARHRGCICKRHLRQACSQLPLCADMLTPLRTYSAEWLPSPHAQGNHLRPCLSICHKPTKVPHLQS